MSERTLTDAKDYFGEVVLPNVSDFSNSPSTFRLAFNAASSLFHQHEWLYEAKRAELEAKYGVSFATKWAFWQQVEKAIPEAKFIRDVANASKHLKLTGSSTGMTHIANTVIRSSAYGEGPYGAGRYGGPNVVMKDGATDVSFDECVKKPRDFWQGLLDELYP